MTESISSLLPTQAFSVCVCVSSPAAAMLPGSLPGSPCCGQLGLCREGENCASLGAAAALVLCISPALCRSGIHFNFGLCPVTYNSLSTTVQYCLTWLLWSQTSGTRSIIICFKPFSCATIFFPEEKNFFKIILISTPCSSCSLPVSSLILSRHLRFSLKRRIL